MSEKKITKREYLETLGGLVKAAEDQGFGLPEGVTFNGLSDFVANELTQLDKKAEAAAKRSAEKRAAGDALRDKILSVLTDEFQPIAAITAALEDTAVSQPMVIPRLKQLKDLGLAEQEQITVTGPDGKSKKASGYKRAEA